MTEPNRSQVQAGGRVLLGTRVVCGETGRLHLDGLFPEPMWWEFADHSWSCNGCGSRHCSECFYETDGVTITVEDCGRFQQDKELHDE